MIEVKRMKNSDFEQYLTDIFKPNKIKDYCPNGLQVEGSHTVNKVITGVTASMAMIEAAIEHKADALVVHHGYFWKNESYVLRGIKQKRIKALLEHNINLYAYHLPLDIHPTLGNNVQLANLLDIEVTEGLELGNPLSIALQGKLAESVDPIAFSKVITEKLHRECLHIPTSSNKKIKTVAWCTGGGQDYIELAAEQGIDAFISGEISEKTTHIAREMDIHFYAAGHHATERYGVKALAQHLSSELGLDATFIDIDNPA